MTGIAAAMSCLDSVTLCTSREMSSMRAAIASTTKIAQRLDTSDYIR
ncbi:protein of unknown function (plasmid) [Pararobbsia alpina]